MKIEEVVKLSPMNRLLYFIKERESIRLKKEAGDPKPWTDDSILRSYRFTNVRRMDDKVSRWLMETWYVPYRDHPNMLIACVLARVFNQPLSLREIGFPLQWLPEVSKEILRALLGKQLVFNPAYRVWGMGGVDKIGSIIDYVVQPLVDDPPEVDTESMRKTWEVLVCRKGLGSFMAGQVVADLRWAMSGRWADRHRWAPAGPGSIRGMNRLHNRPVDGPLSQSRFLEELREVIAVCRKLLPSSITDRLEAHDYQNCLCEFDKMSRVLSGEGKPKQRYKGV